MFDINNIITRYFTILVNGTQLEIEPPKVKTLKKLMAVQKTNNYDDYIEVMSEVLTKNRQKINITVEMIEGMEVDQLNDLTVKFFTWLSEIKNHPNL